MHEIHHEFGRPPGEAGAYTRVCLTSASPTMLEQLIIFCARVMSDDCPPELADVMLALQIDAVAARWQLDDMLDDILDGPAG